MMDNKMAKSRERWGTDVGGKRGVGRGKDKKRWKKKE